MSWFSKKSPRHTHEWRVVAFDPGYSTTHSDGNGQQKHHLQFERCDCGERRLTGADKSPASYHAGITKAGHRWKETNKLLLSDEADIYDSNYQCTAAPNGGLGMYEYLPQTGIQKIISVLKSDAEFVELHNNNTLVAEAFDEFQTVVKLHEGL